MRRRIAALGGLLCLLATGVSAQSNQLSFTHITAPPGDERTLPLAGTFTSGMSGLVVTVLFDPTVIQVLDVSTADLTEDFTLHSSVTDGRLTIAMAAAYSITTVFPESVLELRVRVIGSPGAVTGLDIVSAVVNEGASSTAKIDGSLTVAREASVLGWVLYYADLQAVPDVVLSATGEATVADTTDADGRYQIGPTAVGDYDVSLTRADGSLAAIDALDAVDILRHLIGSIRLSGDQQFVADVSGNGAIGTTDAGLILRFLVGLETSFPAGDFWQFSPSSLQFQPLIQDEFRNFTAFLMGDVDGSWESAGSGKRLAGASPSLRLERVPAGQRQQTALHLGAENLQTVRGGTIEVRYDARALRAVGVERTGLSTDYMLETNLETPGLVRLAFAGVDGLQGRQRLVRLRFQEIGRLGSSTRVQVQSARLDRSDLAPASLASLEFEVGGLLADLNDDGVVNLSDFFLLTDHLGTTDRRYDVNGDGRVDLSDVFVLFDEMTPASRAKGLAAASELGLIEAPVLGQNAPNPFNSDTVIDFRTVVDGPVTLRLFDVTGQQVRELAAGHRAAGTHRVSWDGRDDDGRAVATGAYFYRLEAGGVVTQRKLLLLR